MAIQALLGGIIKNALGSSIANATVKGVATNALKGAISQAGKPGGGTSGAPGAPQIQTQRGTSAMPLPSRPNFTAAGGDTRTPRNRGRFVK
jgi:hypothetical protein